MFNRRDRQFEQQFRWEEDRWVFRFHQGGLPVVVTEREMTGLVAEHVARRKQANRLFFVTLLGLFMLLSATGAMGLSSSIVLVSLIVVPVAVRIALGYWADPMLTRRLRSRPVVGERLGLVGRFKMRAETSRWADLLLQFAIVLLYSFGLPYRVSPATKAVIAAAWVVVVARILIKWVGEQRAHRATRWTGLASRARHLADEGENGGR